TLAQRLGITGDVHRSLTQSPRKRRGRRAGRGSRGSCGHCCAYAVVSRRPPADGWTKRGILDTSAESACPPAFVSPMPRFVPPREARRTTAQARAFREWRWSRSAFTRVIRGLIAAIRRGGRAFTGLKSIARDSDRE